jgi:hypothetical protein
MPSENGSNPFREFDEASKIIVIHYRRLAEKVTLDSGLLLKSVLDTVIELAEVHVRLLDQPPEGTERFLNTVDDRLTWHIYTPPTFFGSQAVFPEHEADDICRRLAVLAMGLLERGRVESAKACGSAIHSIAERYATSARVEPYSLADVFQSLECLARAAQALDQPELEADFRGHMARPDPIAEANWPPFIAAIQTRESQLNEELGQHDRDIPMPDNPIQALKRILEKTELKADA